MKYVLNTVKELIILSGMYFFINLGLSVGIPLLIGYLLSDKSVPLPIGGMTLIMSFVYIVFFFFGKTDMVEYKSKQMTYALLTPSCRVHQVIAKYILAVGFYLLAVAGYAASTFISPSLTALSFGDIAYSVLIFSVMMGVYFLIYYRFGYEAVKFFPQVMMMVGTFGSVAVLNLLNGLDLEGFAESITNMRPVALVLGLAFFAVTFMISCRLYRNKDL